jgi:hypothetical protein
MPTTKHDIRETSQEMNCVRRQACIGFNVCINRHISISVIKLRNVFVISLLPAKLRREPSVPLAGFKPTFPTSKQPHMYALYHTATGIQEAQ